MVRRAENAAERGFLLHVFHRLHKGRDVLYAVGKLESGATFGLMDTRWRPFFYCRVSDRDKVAQRAHGAELVDGELATVDGERVLRVECARVGALRRLARQLEQDGIRTYEADLNFGLHCLMEAGLRGGVEIDGARQPGTGVDRIYVDPQLMPTDYEPELALLVLDIETAPEPWRSTGCRWWAADRVINTASRRSISSERRRTTIPTICSAIPTSARFDREKGILPALLEGFWLQREEAKSRGDAVASYAYKINYEFLHKGLFLPGYVHTFL